MLMPIQFPCPRCTRAIEVDEQFAGQDATCPYCRYVVRVPGASTLAAPVAARPAESALPPGMPPIPSLPGDAPLSPVANRYGLAALLLSIGVVVAIAVQFVVVTSAAASLDPPLSTPMTEEDMKRLGEKVPTILALLPAALAISGLIVSIRGVQLSGRRDWRGIIGLVVCGGVLTCLCGGIVLILAGAMGGAGAV
jgi:hypothetical protein